MIKDALGKLNVPFESITDIIITHQDIDHIGSLPDAVAALGSKAQVIAHEDEKPYIQGDKPLIKMNPVHMQKMIQAMPEAARPGFEAMIMNPPKAPVTKVVKDGEKLDFCGGITVIHTPGHTPGHICLYHAPSKTLISGDALVAEGGKLKGPSARSAENIDLAYKSLEKLLRLDIETVICYHGGVCQGNINERIKEIIKEK
jgi:glyoxylase-like metal-dependent hydrolase (beta-lactamase superfamily II)